MSDFVKIATIVLHLILLALLIATFIQKNNPAAVSSFVILCPVLLLTFLLRPFQYVLNDQGLSIRKYILPKKIAIKDIKSIEPIEAKDLYLRVRLFGSGGIWGWYGYFWTKKGIINMQCTEKENLIIIITQKDQKIIVSPSDSILFIDEVKKQIQSTIKYSMPLFDVTH